MCNLIWGGAQPVEKVTVPVASTFNKKEGMEVPPATVVHLWMLGLAAGDIKVFNLNWFYMFWVYIFSVRNNF